MKRTLLEFMAKNCEKNNKQRFGKELYRTFLIYVVKFGYTPKIFEKKVNSKTEFQIKWG